jgi:hypothetical protein
MDLSFQEKILYQQIHPIKLAVDILTSVISTLFLWRCEIMGFLIVFLAPSVIATIVVIRFANLDKLKKSRFGNYIRRFMTRRLEAVRFLGQFIMWFAAWKHAPLGIGAGVLVIVSAWLSGMRFSKLPP